MSGNAIGHGSIVAFKTNGNAWGGYPAVVSAGDAVEVDRNGLTIDSQIIERLGVQGKKSMLPPFKGSQLVAGDIGPMDFFFEGNHVLLAHAFGLAGAPSTPAGGTAARLHVFKMADSQAGVYGTFVDYNLAAILEYPFVKATGFSLECQSGQALKLTVPAFADTCNFNVGAPAAANIVAAVLPANGDLTILAQPTEPSPLTVTVVDADTSITELILTLTFTDEHGDVKVETYTLSTDGLTFETLNRAVNVEKVVLSGLAGSAVGDTISVGVSNGKNNETSVAAITLPADRTQAVFAQMKLYINPQDGAALDSSLVKSIRSLRLTLANNLVQQVTTGRGRVIDEPLSNGFSNVELGFSFERWSTVTGAELNHDLVKKYITKGPMKVKVEWLGPTLEAITGGVIQYRLTFYMNNVVFTAGNPSFPGPGQRSLDMTGRPSRALAIPTGFPTGYTDALTCELVNKVTTDALA